jgi:hypothetical protein
VGYVAMKILEKSTLHRHVKSDIVGGTFSVHQRGALPHERLSSLAEEKRECSRSLEVEAWPKTKTPRPDPLRLLPEASRVICKLSP